MTRDAALAGELVARLRDEPSAPAPGWSSEPARADLRCAPELIERLTAVARPVPGTARVFVAGCPVVVHANGRAIAAAAATDWLAIRSDLPAGAFAAGCAGADLDPPWQCFDPWAPDVAFAKSTQQLRAHVTRARELAEALTWR